MNALQRRALPAVLGSVALLLGAFAFQYVGGLAPCPICIWQRWPHAIAILLGLIVLAWPSRGLAALAGLAVLAGAGIGLYHSGIEFDWWEGPTTCTTPGPGAAAPAGELLDQILATPVVMCDQIAWSWLGISMAGWNAILSLLIAILWFRAAYASSSASQYR
jgi:disulfide bond formation protein DsbB